VLNLNTQKLIDKVLKEAKWERYAMIISSEWESFVNEHIAEIFPAARVTGILVEEHSQGVAYHCTSYENVASILLNGFKVSPVDNEFLTFGGGVVYCWPESHDVFNVATQKTAILEVTYDGHIMRSIALEDTDPRDEQQILLFPDAIKTVEYVGRGNRKVNS